MEQRGMKSADFNKGRGLIGMRERLEFVNGSLDIETKEGTMLVIKVPNSVKLGIEEDSK